jgi:DNA-directed RNA polymerase omega subunit
MSVIDLGTRAPKYALPDDSEQSIYRFIIVASKRARQLQAGARSFLPTTAKKPTVNAMEEVRRGLVKYEDANRDGEKEMAGQDALDDGI